MGPLQRAVLAFMIVHCTAQGAEPPRTTEEWQKHFELAQVLGCADRLREFPAPIRGNAELARVIVKPVNPHRRFDVPELVRQMRGSTEFFLGWETLGDNNVFRHRVSLNIVEADSWLEDLWMQMAHRSRRLRSQPVSVIVGQPRLSEDTSVTPRRSDWITGQGRVGALVGEHELSEFFDVHGMTANQYDSLKVFFYHPNAEPFRLEEVAELMTGYELVVGPPPARGAATLRLEAYVLAPWGEHDIFYRTVLVGSGRRALLDK